MRPAEEPTWPLRTGPGDAAEQTEKPRSAPVDARRRTLPLDPVPVDEDWEIDEFHTRRLTGKDRDRRSR
jgi:hypothetical protein